MEKKAASITLIENHMPSSGIGNYKGVMLCNRPFAGTQAAANKTASADKSSFSCGVVSLEVGVGASQIPLTLNLAGRTSGRKKKISVVTKHKKWLDELQRTKDEMETQAQEEKLLKELEKSQFMEREAKIRQQRRQENKRNHDIDSDYDDDFKASGTKSKPSNQLDDEKGQKLSSDSKDSKDGPNSSSSTALASKVNTMTKSGKSKPKWAKSASDAKDEEFKESADDEDDLLAFVDNLDFNRYSKDAEVQSMMEKIKLRISELENDIEKDVKREQERKAERDKFKKMMKETPEVDDDYDDYDEADYEPALNDTRSDTSDKDRDLMNDAKRLLRQGKYKDDDGEEYDLEAVHSKSSMAAVIKSIQDSRKDTDTKSVVLNEPIIAVHDPTEGSRIQQKNAIDKLPYMHRNPAV